MQVVSDIGEAPPPKRFSRAFVIVSGVAVFFVFLRLFLSSDRDVLALNSPYDEYWFVHSAARLIWGGSYNQMAFANIPIYSAWLGIENAIGIPARMGIDLAWIAGVSYVAVALFRFSNRLWVGALFWFLCIFHPLFIALFDRALSETLLVVLMPLVLASGLEIWNTRGVSVGRRARIATAVFALSFGLAFHVRKEGSLFLLPLMLLAFCSLMRRAQWWASPRASGLGMRLIVWPLLTTFVIGAGLAGANYVRWGVVARYELAAPGYVRAIAALNRINAGPGLVHVTVTRKARQLAYDNSPTFRELKDFFEGEPGRALALHTVKFTGHEGEIGNGWFYWAVRDAGAMAGWHRNAREAESKYNAIADELNDAADAGRLPVYPSWIPSFLDPDLHKWIGRAPGSSWAALRLVLEADPNTVRPGPESATPPQMAEYIEVVGRRNPVPATRMRGWVLLPAGTSVGLAKSGTEPQEWVVLSEVGRRPDVPGAFSFDLNETGVGVLDEFVVRTADSAEGRLSLDQIRAGALGYTKGAVAATLGVDELAHGRRGDRLERWLSHIRGTPVQFDWLAYAGQIYKVINMALLVLVIAIVSIWAVRGGTAWPTLVLCGIGVAMITSRAALFGILDASSWNGVQARYMAPMIPVFFFVVAVALAKMPYWKISKIGGPNKVLAPDVESK